MKYIKNISYSVVMKRITSIMVCVVFLVGLFSIMPAFAQEEIVYYDQIDLSDAATGKFWVTTSSSSERTKASYSHTGYPDRHYDPDFFVDGFGWETVVQWPMGLNSNFAIADGVTTSTVDGRPVITSSSGTSYMMPSKTSDFVDGKEAVNIITTNDVEIPIGKSYSKISFLTANALGSLSSNLSDGVTPKKTMTVTVEYVGEEPVATTITNEPILGRSSSSASNYIATLNTLSANVNDASFGTSNGQGLVGLFEYSIDVNPEKIVKSIHFHINWNESGNKTTVSIPAVTGSGTVPEHARTFTKIDLTSYATGKFYVDNSNAEEREYAYATKDLFLSEDNNSYKSSVFWPFEIHYRTPATHASFPAQAAIVTDNSGDTPQITSLKSGIPYQMPTKREGLDAKEAVMFNSYGAGINANWGTYYTQRINVIGNYSALHFLMGRAGASSEHSVYVEAHYSDGTFDKLGTGEPVLNNSKRPTGEVIPGSTAAQQTAAENFVADLKSGYSQAYSTYGKYSSQIIDSNFGVTYGARDRICLYEYSLELDPTKTLSYIDFYDGLLGGSGNKTGSSALVSLTMEAPSSDWLTNGVTSTPAVVTDGSVTATIASPVNGKAILAVFNNDERLIGVSIVDITNQVRSTPMTVESTAIEEGGSYSIKVMFWNWDNIKPISGVIVLQ
jgi:hypothetical protein